MLENCGLGINTLSNMRAGNSLAFDNLAKIADYFDCSVDYLLGRNVPTEAVTEEEKEIINMYEQLSDVGQKQVYSYILGRLDAENGE